jgi:hypothetical protein
MDKPLNIFLISILVLFAGGTLIFVLDSLWLLFEAALKRFGLMERDKPPSGTFFPLRWHQSLGEKLSSIFRTKEEERQKFHHREIMKVLLELDEETLEKLFEEYEKEFGAGPARYARRTYRKWKKGEVRPIRQTFERFLVHLPKVLDFDLKCEILRHLMEEYCGKETYKLQVYTDDWEQTLEPLVRKIIDKPYEAQLPAQIERQLKWLAEDESQIAQELLRHSQVEEGKIAVRMLRREFANIEYLLANAKGKTRLTHEIKFPYGTIELEIRKR